jgi:hypothetical protein
MERQRTMNDALRLLNRAWKTKSAIWMSQRWDALSGVAASVADIFSKKYGGGAEVKSPIEQLLKSLTSDSGSTSRTVLQKLVDFVQIFPFTGIVILIDKVDETELTQQSSDASSRLIYPILSHIQLLEVENFGWMFFLWAQIKPYFEGGKFPVRLDKIAHATIDWEDSFFTEMLNARIKYFSNGSLAFKDLFDSDVDVEATLKAIISIAMRSPRELVRLMDTIIVEHDIRNAAEEKGCLLSQVSIDAGLDKYVKERINSVYQEKTLGQIYRLRDVKFTNKDVQGAFRVNAQSARTKIKNWEDAGIVKQTGTRAPEGEQGGKPSFEYSVVDARVERIIRKKLINLEELPFEESEEIGE